MSGDQPSQSNNSSDEIPDDYVTWLAQCDEALATGSVPAADTPDGVRDSLAADSLDPENDLKYLRHVRRLLRSRVLGRVSDQAILQSIGLRNPSSSGPKIDIDDIDPRARLTFRQLDDFLILRQIGCGGMGVVYEAKQMSIGRRVALKVLPFAAMLDPKQLQRFKNEVYTVGQLHHSHIVPIYSVGCDRGVHYYAMQYVEGRTLAQIIQEGTENANRTRLRESGRLPQEKTGFEPSTTPLHALSTQRTVRPLEFFRTVAGIGLQAAEALDYAHEGGVIHRDVKPGNLLLDTTGNIWITDFGLARLFSRSSLTAGSAHVSPNREESRRENDLTRTGDLVGTLRYMSPEQALAKPALVDHRTDIYSLGVTLYELLTLEPALTGNDQVELLRQIAHEEPRSPRRLNQSIPLELETIVLKAIAKNPADRFATAGDLADDLRRFLEDKPILAKRPTLPQRLSKWTRRHRGIVWSAATFFLLASLGLLISTFIIVRQRDLARSNYELAQQQKSLAERHAQEADEQRLLARLNLTRARNAVDEMLTRVATDRLVEVPQMERVRRTLMEDALAFYEQFLEEQSRDPDVRMETARNYRSVAELRLQLGEVSEAEQPSIRSIDLLNGLVDEFPHQPKYREELAQSLSTAASTYGNIGRLQNAEQLLREAIALDNALLADSPHKHEIRIHLVNAHSVLGWVLRERPDEAEEQYRIGIRISESLATESPDNLSYREKVASSYYLLGAFLIEVNRSGEAEQALRHATSALGESETAISVRYPRFLRGGTRLYLAMALEAEGRAPEAEKGYRDAADIFRQLVLDFPHVPGYRGSWHASLSRFMSLLLTSGRTENFQSVFSEVEDVGSRIPDPVVGQVMVREFFSSVAFRCVELGELATAESTLGRVIPMDEQLAAQFPDETSHRLHLAEDYARRAVIRNKKIQPDDAAADFREAARIYDQLASSYPSDLLYHYRLENTLNFMGILARGRLDEAEALHGRAIAIGEKILADAPDDFRYRTELSRGYYSLAIAQSTASQTRAAADSLRQAIRVAEPLNRSRDPAINTYLFPASCCALFEILLRERQYQEADALYGDIIKLDPPDPEGRNHVARLLATCSVPKYRDATKAVEFAQQAAALAPRDPYIWNTLGMAYYRASDWQSAIDALTKSEELAQIKGTSYNTFFLAMAHWQLAAEDQTSSDQKYQHVTSARTWYNKAIVWMDEKDPKDPELKHYRAEADEMFGTRE